MYPNFDNKQDRSSKHQELLARIERDQRLEAMKREACANAIWATDSKDSKTKDATETGDTLARVVAAMRAAASTSNKKTPPGGFSSVSDIYDAMGDASNGFFFPKRK
jgi:predicted ATP-dependent protease